MLVPAMKSFGLDLVLAYGDAAVFGQFNLRAYLPSQSPDLILSQFADTKEAANKVSKMLQDLLPSSQSPTFREFGVSSLDPEITSHSLRRGTYSVMDARGVPPNRQGDAGGHAPRGETAAGVGAEPYHTASDASVAQGEIASNERMNPKKTQMPSP